MATDPRTDDELADVFGEWAEDFANAAIRYDAGDVSAAKQLSVSLRTLFDTHKRNALRALGVEPETYSYYSTPLRASATPLVESAGGGMWRPNQPPEQMFADYLPIFMMFRGEWDRLPFDKWWNEELRGAMGTPLSRRMFVRELADRDGGAHFDRALDPAYAEVRRQKDFKISTQISGVAVSPPKGRQFASIRQIAFEVQLTLDEAIPHLLPNRLAYPVHMKFFPPWMGGTDYGGTSPMRVDLDKKYLRGVLQDLEKEGGGALPKWKYKPE
jgi:hypothetical protein